MQTTAYCVCGTSAVQLVSGTYTTGAGRGQLTRLSSGGIAETDCWRRNITINRAETHANNLPTRSNQTKLAYLFTVTIILQASSDLSTLWSRTSDIC